MTPGFARACAHTGMPLHANTADPSRAVHSGPAPAVPLVPAGGPPRPVPPPGAGLCNGGRGRRGRGRPEGSVLRVSSAPRGRRSAPRGCGCSVLLVCSVPRDCSAAQGWWCLVLPSLFWTPILFWTPGLVCILRLLFMNPGRVLYPEFVLHHKVIVLHPRFVALHPGLALHPGVVLLCTPSSFCTFTLFCTRGLFCTTRVLSCIPGLFCTPQLLFCSLEVCSVLWVGSAPRVCSARRFSFPLLGLFFTPGLFFCSRFCCLSPPVSVCFAPPFLLCAPVFFRSPFLVFTPVSVLHPGLYFECPWLPFPSCPHFTITRPHCEGPAGCTYKCRPGSPLLRAPKQVREIGRAHV